MLELCEHIFVKKQIFDFACFFSCCFFFVFFFLVILILNLKTTCQFNTFIYFGEKSYFIFFSFKKDLESLKMTFDETETKIGIQNCNLNMTENVLPGKNFDNQKPYTCF